MDIRVIKFEAKINKAGKAVDWVEYGGAHSIQTETTLARVNDLIPPDEFERDGGGQKMTHMRAVWSFIEPKYRAWKDGREMPETGTPLSAWPGVSEAEIYELNRVGLKSVEDVAGMSESALDKVALPNPRDVRKQAKMFMEAVDAQQSAAVIAELQERLAAAEELLAEKPKRGRPPKQKPSEAA